MKDYGCSNIDDLVDELKRLRIENKELKSMLANANANTDLQNERFSIEREELQNEIKRLKKIVFELQPKPYFEDASKYYED